MTKKIILIVVVIVVFVFAVYRTIASVKAKKSGSFANNPNEIQKTGVHDAVASFYALQAFQSKDDYLGTYKDEESTWTNQADGIVGTTGLISGEIRKDERTGLWWSASSLSTTITNHLDVVETDGLRLKGGNAIAFCDGLNKAAFGGKSDWYLPTQKELMQAYIDGIYSQDPEFGTRNPFWASTEQNLYYTKLIWYGNVSTGVIVDFIWSTPVSVRCVRREDFTTDKTFYANQALQAQDDNLGTYKNEEATWTDLPEGVVGKTGLISGEIRKDERTGLWWSASSLSTTITNHLDVVETDGLRLKGGNAIAFCDGLNKAAFGGKSDWYLPTQKELMQAYIDGIYSQDPEFGTRNPFWASTVLSTDSKTPWCVDLAWGFVYLEDNFIENYFVRCVRRD